MATLHHLAIKPKTFDLIMKDCKIEFLDHHPYMKGMKITQDMIARRIAEYYLGITYTGEND